MENKSGEAKVQKVKNWSPVWIFPIVTALIGAWILFYHYSHQGPEVTLITTNAEGIEGGKTRIKSRSVDVGVIESATLTDDLTHVEIKARLNSGMEKLLHQDSVFGWLNRRSAVKGLAVWERCYPAPISNCSRVQRLCSCAVSAAGFTAAGLPDAKGIRILLESSKAGQLSPGDPVLSAAIA
jgi:paraquat-inducible protein B